MKTKPSKSTIRAVGQRSIDSTLLFRPHPPNQISAGDTEEDANAGPPPKRVSFSDYLNRRLHSNSVLPLALQRDRNKHIKETNQSERREQQRETEGVIEESIFKQFNLANAGQENEQLPAVHADSDEVEAQSANNVTQKSRKRRNAFEGHERSSEQSHLLILGEDVSNHRHTRANKRLKELCDEGNGSAVRKHVVVLGDDPKPKRGAHRQSSLRSEQSKDQYNHYENGAGWWDYEKEGVDNDEVGATEVWEGVGSTTLGGIVDWH
ncbi:hypothetical protein V2J09_022941 [Rumex salicifolius]